MTKFACCPALLASLWMLGCGSSVSVTGTDDADVDATADASDTSPIGDDAADAIVADAKPEVADTSVPTPFGGACTKDAECLSGICLSIGHCSRVCANASECPTSTNWKCVSLPGRGPACDCTVLSAIDIPCNGVDDDCNGLVDDTAKTCGGVCTDVQNDSNNCGGCGVVCGGGTSCKAGACACPATKPQICGTQCVDTNTDVANCGSCNKPCAAGPNGAASCAAGACALACNVPYGNCNGSAADGCETDLRSDLANCGACGKSCSYSNATATCSTGTCLLSACSAGYANCNKDPVDGCEINVNNDLANCGGCGAACAPANASGSCNAGKCELLLCKTGFANCNANATDGCEINTQTDPNNCSTCGHVCPGAGAPNAIAACTTGACGVACVAGYANCDGNWGNGCEVGLQSDVNNCGTCGNVCALGNVCSAGICQTSSPVDVTILLDVSGSTNTIYTATATNTILSTLQTRVVAPLLALSATDVGVSYTCDFPVSPYGGTGDRAFQGGLEPSTNAMSIDAAITGRPTTQSGGDTSDGMVEALGTLSGLPVHTTSLALTCSAGKIAGGCWRPGAKRVIILITDDEFHGGPDPASASLYDPYTLVSPAPQTWTTVLPAMQSSNTVLLIMNIHASGTTSPGAPQYLKMLTNLGQPATDAFLANTNALFGTAADAVVARIKAIHG